MQEFTYEQRVARQGLQEVDLLLGRLRREKVLKEVAEQVHQRDE